VQIAYGKLNPMEKRPATNAEKLRKHKAGIMTRLKEIQAELAELTEAVKALSERQIGFQTFRQDLGLREQNDRFQ
jgi:hypothetical protein